MPEYALPAPPAGTTISADRIAVRITHLTTAEVVAVLATATADMAPRGAETRTVVAHLLGALTDRLPAVAAALDVWDHDLDDDRTAAEVALTTARQSLAIG